jgi:hypothetical protein
MKNTFYSLLLLCCMFFASSSLPAQSAANDLPPPRLNEAHLSLLGPGGWGSVGYQRRIPALSTRIFSTALGASVGYYRVTYYGNTYQIKARHIMAMPEVNTLWFKGHHHLDLGILAMLDWEHNPRRSNGYVKDRFYPGARLGYRFDGFRGKGFVRIGLAHQIIDAEVGTLILPYLGFGLKF